MRKRIFSIFLLLLGLIWNMASILSAPLDIKDIERRYEVKDFDQRLEIILPERPLSSDVNLTYEISLAKKAFRGKAEAYIRMELIPPAGAGSNHETILISSGQSKGGNLLIPKGYKLRIEMYAGKYQVLFAKSGALGVCKFSYPELTVHMDEATEHFTLNYRVNGLAEVDRWVWNFGDGQETEGDRVTHTYPTPGSYLLNLSGYQGNRLVLSYQKEIMVPEVIELHPTVTPLEGVVEFEVEAKANLKAHYGERLQCTWDFGDGSSPVDAESATHRYTQVGRYPVTMTVRSMDSDNYVVKTWNITAKPISIISRATVTPQEGPASLTIVAKAETTTEGSPIKLHYAWDFGDGTTSDKAQTIHTYTKPGNYEVTLQVWDEYHPEIKLPVHKFPIIVTPPTLRIDPVAYPADGSAPLKVSFFPNLWVDGSPTDISFSWNFGDGERSSEPEPTHIYERPGTYNIVLVVRENIHQLMVSAVLRVKVSAHEWTIDGSVTPTKGKAPLNIECTAKLPGDNANYEARWDFGDGQNAMGTAVNHSYKHPGIYIVRLRMWSKDSPEQIQEKHFEIVVTEE